MVQIFLGKNTSEQGIEAEIQLTIAFWKKLEKRGGAAFDQNQPRDPETGEWISGAPGTALSLPLDPTNVKAPAELKMPHPEPMKPASEYKTRVKYMAAYKKYFRDMIDSENGGELRKIDEFDRREVVKSAARPGGKKEPDYALLDFFADDPDWEVREVVAEYGNEKQMAKLMTDPHHFVRRAVAYRLDPAGLHGLTNDPDEEVKRVVASRIDQAGLHKMLGDKSEDRDRVLYVVAKRIDQTGLHKMISGTNEATRKIVASRIDQAGLHRMMGASEEAVFKTVISRIEKSGLQEMYSSEGRLNSWFAPDIKKRLDNLKALEPTIKSYEESGKIDFSEPIEKQLREIVVGGGESTAIISTSDEFYNTVSGGKFNDFHKSSRSDWESSSSSNLALALKDSVKRQYGGEIRYHDAVKDYDKELNDKIYTEYPKELIDEYVRTQKSLTRAYLDKMYPDTNEITIYRGTTKSEVEVFDAESTDTKVQVKSNPLSSWSLKPAVADKFATNHKGIVLTVKVNKDEIWSTFMTHAYTGNEREILLIGNKDRVISVSKPGGAHAGAGGEFVEEEHPRSRDPNTGEWVDTGGVSSTGGEPAGAQPNTQ